MSLIQASNYMLIEATVNFVKKILTQVFYDEFSEHFLLKNAFE